jgi:hypothetical protein
MSEDKKLKNKLRKRKSRAKIRSDSNLHSKYKLEECTNSKKYYLKKHLNRNRKESNSVNLENNKSLKYKVR